jgi:hypothetical protein
VRKLLLASAAFTLAAAAGVPGSALAEDVDITTSTNAGVNLDTFTGSTARVFPGVTVDNTVIFNGTGISATTQAWTLTNQGTVTGGNSISFTQGGVVTNSAGAQINAGLSGIVLSTFNAGGAGTVDNFGTITANVEGVTLRNGGTVTNFQGATISTTGGNNAVSVGQGSSRTVVNSGEIHADKTTGFSTGVLVQGGAATVTNNSTGIITGGFNGIFASASALLSFTNNGSITSARGPAVEARGGGTFTNTGTIQSGNDGMFVAGANPATIINSGTIGSTGAGRSIAFSGASTHTLNLLTGSVLTGNVQGGTGTDNLVLQGTGTESIAKFLAFETLSMQGADWALTGIGTFTNSTTVTSGVLRVNGQLTSPTVTVAVGGTLGGSGTVVGSSLTNNGVLEGTGGDTLALNIAIANGGTIRANGGNVNANTGFTGTGTASTIGTGVLAIAANSTVGTLLNNGSSASALTLGTSNITVSGDYSNASFGTGNSFNHRSNVTGGGLILAAGDVNQAIIGAVTGGTTASPVLNFGSVHVGDNVSQNYQIANIGTTGPVLRGAIQTGINGGNITDARLTGTGVTAGNFGPVLTGGNSGNQAVTFNASTAGALSGQAVHIQNNFDNIQDQTISIQGAAYNLAAGSASPDPVVLGNQRVGGTGSQVLTISNTAPSGSFTEGLNASFGANSGDAINNAGSISLLAGGGVNNASMSVGVNTATAGAKSGTVTLNYVSDGEGTSGLGQTNLPSQTVNVSGNVYRLANGTLNTPSVNLAARVGDASPTAAISISNSSPDVFTEGLNASIGGTAAPFTSSGSISNLAAQGTAASALQVGLNTATAGTSLGTATVNFTSTGAGTTGAADVSVGSAVVNLVGKVYQQAVAQVNTLLVDFGIVHRGDAVAPVAVSVSNTAPVAGLNDVLQGSLGGASGPFSASGTLGAGVAAGATDSSSLTVALDTSATGVFNGSATASLTSHNADMADLVVGGIPVVLLSAQVNDFANADLRKIGGEGSLSRSSLQIVLDFGNVTQGSGTHSTSLEVFNNVAGLGDLLDGQFSFIDANDFLFSGFNSFADLAAGSHTGSLGVSFDAVNLGAFSDTIVLASLGHNASGFSGALPDVTLLIKANVTAGSTVPEPESLLLMAIGMAALIASRRRARMN